VNEIQISSDLKNEDLARLVVEKKKNNNNNNNRNRMLGVSFLVLLSYQSREANKKSFI